MSKDSITDYLSCILLRLLGPVIRSLPLSFSFFLGARLGDLFYCLDFKHRAVVYANIKAALNSLSPLELKKISRDFFRVFGQNLIEIFLIPLIDKEYLKKYIEIEGYEHLKEAFAKGKGVIFLGVHEGSWELSNIISANLGFPFNMFIRGQRYPRLDKLLNSYRRQKGSRIIQRENQTREVIRLLKNNESIGMTADQGGKLGIQVKFFAKFASMPSGAVRLALKYDAAIVPCFYIRKIGPYIKIFVEPAFKIKKTGDLESDIRNNLQELVRIFESRIRKYPREYLWSYKVWKYAQEKSVLILSDGKAGHLRQSEAVGNLIQRLLKDKGVDAHIDTVEVKFKSNLARHALTFSNCLAGKYNCQGCLWCFRKFLDSKTYQSLLSFKPDVVISCGSSLAPVNFVLSRENLAKSIAVMRPSILSTRRFDLVVMSSHDNPPKRKNVVITEGALNIINCDYLASSRRELEPYIKISKDLIVGFLVGGDTKEFRLNKHLIGGVVGQLKESLDKFDGQILVTTSRRTNSQVEGLIRKEFKDYPRCKFLVIANEKNPPHALGGILALSRIIIASPESISMISEAASSGCYVIVFKSKIDRRHNDFLENLARKKYIYLIEPERISSLIEELWDKRPAINILKDDISIECALKRII